MPDIAALTTPAPDGLRPRQSDGGFAAVYAHWIELPARPGIRFLPLTLLALGIVEAILDGTQGPEVTLARVLMPCSVRWEEQWAQFS